MQVCLLTYIDYMKIWNKIKLLNKTMVKVKNTRTSPFFGGQS